MSNPEEPVDNVHYLGTSDSHKRDAQSKQIGRIKQNRLEAQHKHELEIINARTAERIALGVLMLIATAFLCSTIVFILLGISYFG
jgi:hypothetical protein